MTKVSKHKLSSHKEESVENDFWKAVALLKNETEVRLFFHDLLTHTERKMLAKRLQTARSLLEGKGYFEIRLELKVTPNTIAKVNNGLNTSGEGYRLAISRLRNK